MSAHARLPTHVGLSNVTAVCTALFHKHLVRVHGECISVRPAHLGTEFTFKWDEVTHTTTSTCHRSVPYQVLQVALVTTFGGSAVFDKHAFDSEDAPYMQCPGPWGVEPDDWRNDMPLLGLVKTIVELDRHVRMVDGGTADEEARSVHDAWFA
jgi:hypothetical protein